MSANADVELDVPRIEAVVVDDEASASTYQSNASLTSTIVWLMSFKSGARHEERASLSCIPNPIIGHTVNAVPVRRAGTTANCIVQI